MGGPVCGDGLVEGDEACDDGDENGDYGMCLSDCSGIGAHCGDGTTDPPEECDDGNLEDLDGCSMECVFPGSVAWQHALMPEASRSVDNLVIDGLPGGGVVLGVQVHDAVADTNDTWLRALDASGTDLWDTPFANAAWIDSSLGDLDSWPEGDSDHALYVVGSATTDMGTFAAGRWFALDGTPGGTTTYSADRYDVVDVGPAGQRYVGAPGVGAVVDFLEYFPEVTGLSSWSYTIDWSWVTVADQFIDPNNGDALMLANGNDALIVSRVAAADQAATGYAQYQAEGGLPTHAVEFIVLPSSSVVVLGNYEDPKGNIGFVRMLDPTLALQWQETGPIGVHFDAIDINEDGQVVVAGTYGGDYGALYLYQLMPGGALALQWETLGFDGRSVDVAFDGLGAIYRASTSPDAVWKHAG